MITLHYDIKKQTIINSFKECKKLLNTSLRPADMFSRMSLNVLSSYCYSTEKKPLYSECLHSYYKLI